MKTVKFHKSECGVDLLLNVLKNGEHLKEYYNDSKEPYNTDFFEILFFKKGAGSLILNQNILEISDNTVIFISAFQKRKWKITGHDSDFTTLVFQEAFLNDFFADKFFITKLHYFYQLQFPLILPITSNQMDKYSDMLEEIKKELILVKVDSAHIIRSLLYYLLQTLNREYAERNNLSIHNTDSNFAYQFKTLLERHIKEKQRVTDYAELLGISRISLNKFVKDQFGVTANDLIKQRLIFEIKNELVHSDKTMTEIAYDLNFSEPSHLMRFFKTVNGATATEFLRSYNMKTTQ